MRGDTKRKGFIDACGHKEQIPLNIINTAAIPLFCPSPEKVQLHRNYQLCPFKWWLVLGQMNLLHERGVERERQNAIANLPQLLQHRVLLRRRKNVSNMKYICRNYVFSQGKKSQQ